MSNRNKNTNNRKSTNRSVYNVTKNGPYRRFHKLRRLAMAISRGDTRHGGTSKVELWMPTDDGSAKKIAMSLAEARSLRAFLERELQTLAR